MHTDPTTNETKLWNLILNNSTVDIIVRPFQSFPLLPTLKPAAWYMWSEHLLHEMETHGNAW
jgi:hypothetical protein